jgi:phospholysine phosphohistidine inorganic pyrophosphate phosphatase
MNARPDLVLLDLDGTVYQDGKALPGTIEALNRLQAGGLRLVFVTNTTMVPVARILQRLWDMGLRVDPDRVRSPLQAARDRLLGQGLHTVRALVRPAAREDLAGLELLAPDVCDVTAQAVLVGDMGRDWSYEALDRAFRDLMHGAAFFSCQSNRYYRKGEDLVLDAGAFVAALEYASGRQAEVLGKPGREFFLAPAREMWHNEEELHTRLRAGAVWMVGDDLEMDISAARQAGLRGIMVRTGKFRPGDEIRARLEADEVLDSVADLPDRLGL